MTLETVSTKRNRVYARRFDHDEARIRYEGGASLAQLARDYGVSGSAVAYAVNDRARARMEATTRASQTKVCEECRGVARPSSNRPHPDGRVLCRDCRGISRRTRFELTPGGVAVAAWCSTCKRMLDLHEFPGGSRYRDVRSNGVHNQCSACQTETRRERRHKTRVPCSHGCGAMVDRNPAKQPECRPCASRRSTALQKAEGRLFRAKVAA